MKLLSLALCASVFAAATTAQVDDAEIATYRTDLLDIALSAASMYPLDPHIKNRSRAQEQVATTAFQLHQPSRALGAVESISNWRRGTGLADYALYCIRAGELSGVEEMLEKAERVASTSADVAAQGWRAERIRAKIAQAYLLLGDTERAATTAKSVMSDSETGKVAIAKAERSERAEVGAQLDELQATLDTQSFDLIQSALPVYALLYGRFYDDEVIRARIERAVQEGWRPVPVDMRLATLETMADHALAHDDGEKAAELIGRSKDLIDAMTVTAEFSVPILARFAALLHRAGQTTDAREHLAHALELFHADREMISMTFRPDTLVPVAESYVALGNPQRALQVYEQALAEALVSPNSRPRTDDLVTICCSLALHDVHPGEAFMQRILSVHASLGAPW